MPHGDMKFGPGYYIIIGIYVLVAVSALFIIFDAMRPKRSDTIARLKAQGLRRGPLWIYQILAGIYLIVFILAQFPVTPHQFKAAAVLSIPLMVAVDIVYLLRVVFPKQSTPTPSEEFFTDEHH